MFWKNTKNISDILIITCYSANSNLKHKVINMTFSIRQLTLVVCIITKVICNNIYCNDNIDKYSCSTEEQSLFGSDVSLSDKEEVKPSSNLNTINNIKCEKKDNDIHNFKYYQNIYQKLLSDISKFKNDIKFNHNDQYNIEIKNTFFTAMHNIKDSLQKLTLSCSDMKERNKISTYINNNLKSRDIYLILE